VTQKAINDYPPSLHNLGQKKWIKDRFTQSTQVVPFEEPTETREDIHKYLAHGFNQIHENRTDTMDGVLTLVMPSHEDMTHLVGRSIHLCFDSSQPRGRRRILFIGTPAEYTFDQCQ